MSRADGYKLKHTDPMYRIASHIMAKRSDALNSITVHIPLDPVNRYLQEKRREGKPMSHMAVIMASYVRLITEFPALNRFVVNKTAYARKEIAFGMVVLGLKAQDGTANDGTMSKVYFQPEDTIFDVQNKIDAYVAKNRQADNSTEALMRKLTAVPGLLRFAVCLIKWADKHGLLPKSVIDASPFHCTMVFSNLASIRTNHIHHHCYDFGTTSLLMVAGNSVLIPRQKGDRVEFEKCMPLGIVMDERICSGSYFAKAFRRMREYLADPHLLETPPAVVVPDPEI